MKTGAVPWICKAVSKGVSHKDIDREVCYRLRRKVRLMRITNKVMQNNALRNINRNKELQDVLNTELATGKKVNKPSDDPVVAIRALRLRSDVTQISQYSKKNVPDAMSWLELTESSIKTTVSVVKDMIEQCEKGSNDTLTTEDRQIIIDALKELRNEVYATGDADYAGRYIFTGYRTDISLTYTAEEAAKSINYEITELFDADDLEQITYIDNGGILDLSEANYSDASGNAIVKEQDIDDYSYYRFRMSYDNLADVASGASITVGSNTYNIQTATDPETVYKSISGEPDSIYYIASTGELVMGENVYNDIKNSDDEYSITYNKDKWVQGDLKPQHYFYCVQEKDEFGQPIVDDDGNPAPIEYNPEYLTTRSVGQNIEYQVGFNQNIQVNTYAEEIYQHDIGRDVDEIIDLANSLRDVELMRDKLDSMSKDSMNYSDAEREQIKIDFESAEKAASLLKDQLQKRFSKYITHMQGYLDGTNDALTLVGSRSARLELISNRLDDQTTTFKTLQSDNEDADATEVAVQLSSAKISYQAALMATSDMIQETLLNYL